MVKEFPGHTVPNAGSEEFRITLDLTVDLPKEVADQLEMWESTSLIPVRLTQTVVKSK